MRPPQVSPAPWPPSPAPPAPAASPSTRGGVRVVGVAERLRDHRVAVVDRALDARGDDRLAGEPAPVADPDVDGEDHRGGVGDHVAVQRRGAGRALRLDVDVDAGALGGGLEGLGGHVGVRDAGRAGGHGHQAAPAGRAAVAVAGSVAVAVAVPPPDCGRGGGGRRSGGGGGLGRADHVVDQPDHLVRVLGGAQRVGELGLDQRPGQLGEQLEVGGVAAGGGGDQEGQVGRTVLGAELDRGGEARERERRHVDRGGAAVRDRDAAGQPRGRGGLAGQRVLDELALVRGAAGVGDHGGEAVDHLQLVGAQGGVEPHEITSDHLGHVVAPVEWLSGRTVTRSGWVCEGLGTVVPTRPTAALPYATPKASRSVGEPPRTSPRR